MNRGVCLRIRTRHFFQFLVWIASRKIGRKPFFKQYMDYKKFNNILYIRHRYCCITREKLSLGPSCKGGKRWKNAFFPDILISLEKMTNPGWLTKRIWHIISMRKASFPPEPPSRADIVIAVYISEMTYKNNLSDLYQIYCWVSYLSRRDTPLSNCFIADITREFLKGST